MPVAAYITLFSFGLFTLAGIYYAALTFFSPSQLYILLILLTLSCMAFAVVESGRVIQPDEASWIVAVQLTYALIVTASPLLLLTILKPTGWLDRALKGLVIVDAATVLLVAVCAILCPRSILGTPAAGVPEAGPVQLIRAVVGQLNWFFGLVIVGWQFRTPSRPDVQRYLFFGYIILSLGSLFDAFLIYQFVESGAMTLGFYPGMIVGLMLFHISVTLSLSQSFRDREMESEHSVHAMEESKKELMRMAYYDDMTGRPNRKSFLLHINNHIIEALAEGKMKAIFLLDLDDFRDINDTFGYTYGDLVIKDVGEKIEDRFGVRDRLYRLYGNQFAIIWDDVRDRGHALDLARMILDDLTSLVEIDRANLYMGVSLGAVLLPDDGDEVSDVFRRCETALAEAKKDKNTYFFYSSELENRTLRKMSIVNSLREALKKDQFHVVYQPIVDRRGRLAELEALTRCRHPALKDVSPEVFISVAESSGLIIPLTWWMLERVVQDLHDVADRLGKIRVNVNMSPKILKSRDLIDRFRALSERRPLSGAQIGFEITESAIIENVDQVLKNLRALRERGFRFALDDFGTGYSSLAYIKNLPLDTIKIDKRFVSGISRDSRDEALINSIVSIASNLKMDLVAEGVEMPNQLSFLTDRGCRYYQGFLFSRPVSIDEILPAYPRD